MTPDLFARAESAAAFVLSQTALRPKIGLVLGSGLGAFADDLIEAVRIPYEQISSFPRSTAIGHAGQLVIGKSGEVPVAVMQGRVHLYEGYSAAEVAFPTRVLGRMGIRALILTNAAGGINTAYGQGALVMLRDHINLQGQNPLTGANDERFGHRFPDMSYTYSKRFREIALEEARKLSIRLTKAFMPHWLVQVMKRRRRYVFCAPSARTWSVCPRCRRRSQRGTWGLSCSPFLA